jgi:hypothetical protein
MAYSRWSLLPEMIKFCLKFIVLKVLNASAFTNISDDFQGGGCSQESDLSSAMLFFFYSGVVIIFRLAGNKVIHGNLLTHHCSLLEMLLN